MIETLINNVDNLVLAFVQGSFGSLTATVQILWRLMFIIFIAIYGYKIIISGRFSAGDLLMHIVKIIVILAIATQWDTFTLIVYDMVTELPSDIAGQIMLGASNVFTDPAFADSPTANTALSGFYDRSMEVSAKVLEGAGWSDMGLYLYALLIWVGAIGFTGYAAMLIILSKLAVALLLSVAPIFILLLMFANTKNLFEGWLRTLLNYAVIPIFVYGLLALLLTLAEAPLAFLEANSNPDDSLSTSIGAFSFTSFVCVLLLAQIMNISGSITGGLSLSTFSAAAGAARGVAGGAGGLWRKARGAGGGNSIPKPKTGNSRGAPKT